MARFMEPRTGALRQPTDNAKENGQIVNPPRFAALGGLDKPSRVSDKNIFAIKKPGGR